MNIIIDKAQAVADTSGATKELKRKAAALLGKFGGLAGTGKAKARTSAQARKAALERWHPRKHIQ